MPYRANFRWMRATAVRGVLALALILSVHTLNATAPATPKAVRLTVADAIGPATSDYIRRGIRSAHEHGASLVILKLDTPGGLDTAMRDIIRAILASPLPVVTYVAPSGARAASAGTYILYASHVAAMAPATNLGAATPVALGGLPDLRPEPVPDTKDPADDQATDKTPQPPATGKGQDAMTKKIVNDAVAYIRGLATMRGRNAEWAERAVRDGASLSSDAALAAGVIDLIAPDEHSLLMELSGRVVQVNGHDVTLDTEDMALVPVDPDWRTEFLAVITNPNIAYILMLLGIYGLFFELTNPGYMLPGVIGAVCLLTALYALQVLPVNYAGLALLLVGIGFMIGELFAPSFGALGIGGVIAFAIGSLILFDSETGHYQVSMSIIIAVTTLTAAFFLFAVREAMKAHSGPVVSGREQLIGSIGIALEDFDERGRVRAQGEIWSAKSSVPLRQGARARIVDIDGLILQVEPIKDENK